MSDNKEKFTGMSGDEFDGIYSDDVMQYDPDMTKSLGNADSGKKGIFSGGEFGGEEPKASVSEDTMDNFYKELFGEERAKAEPNIDDTVVVPSINAASQTDAPKAEEEKNAGTDDFEIDFDFEKEYGEQEEEESTAIVKRRKGRRTGCVGGILYFLFILCISIILAVFLWMAATDVLALGKPDGEVEVTIPEGYTMDQVEDILYSNNLIKYKSVFGLYANFSHAEEKIDEGTYILNTNYDYRALVNGMSKDTGKLVEVEVTIPEGYSLMKIFNLLEENKVCDAEDLWETAANYDFDYDFLSDDTLGEEKRLEGYLFPDTYNFYMSDDPEDVIDKMLYNYEGRITEEMYLQAETLGYSMADVLKVASLVEREAGSDEERATIASVIYNRLESDSFPYLGLDSTIHYAIAGTDEEFSTELDSPYNSYTNAGLPPTPIANPGMSSIKAALNPDDTDYYYFALSISGTHEFFTNSDSFYAFINSEEYAG